MPSYDLPYKIQHPSTLGDLFVAAGLDIPDAGKATWPIQGFTDDSRQVMEGGVFIAVSGEAVDGHDYIAKALDKGAAAIICERELAQIPAEKSIILSNTRKALPRLAHAWWGNPSRGIPLVAVTGTNGKTTTVFLTEALMKQAGHRPAIFTTVEYRFDKHRELAPTTTPGALHLARLMAEFRAQGANAFAMEASSHALVQGRLDAIRINVGLMTNLTQDHLDYHETMREYAAAKQLLFTRLAPDWSVFNLDDTTAARFFSECTADKLSYSIHPGSAATIRAESLEMSAEGIRMEVCFAGEKEEESHLLESPLRGAFNASNLLAACSIGFALGMKPDQIVQGLRESIGAPGRFEAVHGGQPFGVYVDYAHTPDAVERLLLSARQITAGRLICVLGCGGNRDAAKRPIMGAALGRLADYSIITNDNPRDEDPEIIASQMEAGIREETDKEHYTICLDREAAMRKAVEMAKPGDTVMVAGKGHEDYQIVGKERRHFDDREELLKICHEIYGGETE
ncbi:MAG: UDP-N-acetylmuramoyl-L-alanyl-D-glutamate--2,6-diaminopimelate ligase [Candidatus Sumerlaeia bacterium]